MCCRLVIIFIERESDMCQRFQQNIFTRINVSKFKSCAKFDNCTILRFFFILKLKSFNIYAFAVHCCYRYPPPVVGYENALNNIRWSPQSRDDIQLTAYRENDVMGINPDGDNLKSGVRLGGEECCFEGFLSYAKCVINFFLVGFVFLIISVFCAAFVLFIFVLCLVFSAVLSSPPVLSWGFRDVHFVHVVSLRSKLRVVMSQVC